MYLSQVAFYDYQGLATRLLAVRLLPGLALLQTDKLSSNYQGSGVATERSVDGTGRLDILKKHISYVFNILIMASSPLHHFCFI